MMFKPDEREYRSFESFSLEKGSDEKMVTGYASTFDEYVLRDFGDEVWTEKISRDAFNETNLSDVVFLRDHNGPVLARTKNETLQLSVDDHGLFSKTDLSKTSTSRAMYEDIDAGLYDQMSFGFVVGKQHFIEEERDGKVFVHRIIDSVRKIFDVSAVAFPANPTTDIGIATRSAFDGGIEELRAERLKNEKEMNEMARQRLLLKLKMEEQEK